MQDIRKGICPLCTHDKIIEAFPADHTGYNGDMNMSVTETNSWRGPKLHGTLVTYVCAECGFTQWFTVRPNEVPIGPDYRTSIISGSR